MTRVLHSISSIWSGGVERRHALLVESTPDGWAHDVLATNAHGPIVDRFNAAGAEVREVGVAVWRRALSTHQRIGQWKPDLVHGAVIDGYAPAAFAARARGVPMLLEETSDPTNRSWRGIALARAAAAAATHCVAVSPTVGAWMAEHLRIPDDRLTVISNGVPRPTLPGPATVADQRRAWGIPDDNLVVGSVGRMHDEGQKRFGDLLEALIVLERDHGRRDVTLLLVGDGREQTGLQDRATALGIADRVVLTGFQEDVGPAYGVMDVFALASSREAFGLVSAEAMRCGLPVVATRVGGLQDVVEDGVTGLLVPPASIRDLAAALDRVLDPTVGAVMGEEGRQRADRLFSSERYVADVLAMYDRVQADHHKRRT